MNQDEMIDRYAKDLVRQTRTVTNKLRELADRLDRVAGSFTKPMIRGGASGVAADIVNDYIQGCGPQGTFLWSIVRDAAEVDRLRREAESREIDREVREDRTRDAAGLE